MKREVVIGGVAVVLCLVCMILAFILWPAPVAAPLFFLAGVSYGLAMDMAYRYAEKLPNAAFTENQQREIDTTYEELKQKIQGMRK